jgi:ADP-ribose pyrophosphatase
MSRKNLWTPHPLDVNRVFRKGLTGGKILVSEEKLLAEYPDHPRVAVGAIVIKDDRVLLVKRSRPPGEGLWAIPGGRVELGETLQQAAEREIKEETGLTIQARDIVYTFEVIEPDDAGRPRFHYVIVDLMAEYVKGELSPSDDASEARWVSSQELGRLPVSQATTAVLKKVVHFGH